MTEGPRLRRRALKISSLGFESCLLPPASCLPPPASSLHLAAGHSASGQLAHTLNAEQTSRDLLLHLRVVEPDRFKASRSITSEHDRV